MSRLSVVLSTILLAFVTNASASMTYFQCLGVDSNFTMEQGEVFTWHADCDSGAEVRIEIWVDMNGNRQIDEDIDYAWQDGFIQTDGGPGNQGPGDMDTTVNGEVYFELSLGLAPADWILRGTDLTDNSTQTCWGTITPLTDPFRVISGTLSGPMGFDAAYRMVEIDDDGIMWSCLSDSNGVYYLNLDSTSVSASDTVPIKSQDVTGYVAPGKLDVVLATGDTLYNNDFVYLNPAARVFGVLKDDRGSIVSGDDIYITTEPNDGGDRKVVRPDANGAYEFIFSATEVGADWRFNVYYGTYPNDHMQPTDSTFMVSMNDSIEYNFIALYTDTVFTGTVTESGGTPSKRYLLRFWSDAGYMKVYSNATSGAYSMPISSSIKSGQGSVYIDTTEQNGTPLPADYTVEGNWYKGAAGGDVVDFDILQGALIVAQLFDAADSSALSFYNQIELFDWGTAVHQQQQTDSLGAVTFEVSPGDYRIYIHGDQGFSSVWHNGQQYSGDADTLRVSGGETLEVKIYLVKKSSISGMVRGDDYSILVNHGVEVRDAMTYNFVSQVSTDSSGYYVLTGLDAGSYTIRAFDDNGYKGEYYDNVQNSWEAVTINLGTGQDVSGYDFFLAKGASLSGYVQSTDSAAIANIQVLVYDNKNSQQGQAYTDSSGFYTITGLATGYYTVNVPSEQGYIGAWWENQTDQSSARTLSLNGNDTTGINFYLAMGASLTGEVRGEQDSVVIGNMQVTLYTASGGYVAESWTDTAGVFLFNGLAAGDYKYTVATGNGFIGEWYDNAGSSDDAATITLGNGEHANGYVTYLGSGASLSGYMYAQSDSAPVYNMQVMISDLKWVYSDQVYTDSSGFFIFTGLSLDSYQIYTDDRDGFIGEYYNNAATRQEADTIVVGLQDTIGFDFYLTKAAYISGYIRSEKDSTAMAWAEVRVMDGMTYDKTNNTDPNGYYEIMVAPGSYFVAVTNPPTGYIGEEYDNNALYSYTDTLTLASEDTLAGVDMYLAQGGSIGGTVRRLSDSTVIKYLTINIYDTLGNFIQSNQSDYAGQYQVGSLMPGVYHVRTATMSTEFVDQYYDGVYDVFSATDIVVSSGDQIENIDFFLEAPGVLAGYVVSDVDTSLKLANIQVTLYATNDTMTSVGSQWTDGSGRYIFPQLSLGTYFIQFSDMMGSYQSELLSDATGFSTADTLVFNTIGDTSWVPTEGLDVPRGSLAGVVERSLDSTVLESVAVLLYRETDNVENGPFMWAYADSNGAYLMAGIPAKANYYVLAYGEPHNYVNQWYYQSIMQKNANTVYINENSTFVADFMLDTGAVMSGTVQAAFDSVAVESAMVVLLLVSDSSTYASTMTDAQGNFMFSGLPATDFFMACYAGNLGYGTMWWQGQASIDSAHAVTVMAGQNVSGYDFYLEASGSISGVVAAANDSAFLQDMEVEVYDVHGTWVFNTKTDAAGAYTLDGLVPATYFLRIGSDHGFLGQWWSGTTDFSSANTVQLVHAADTAGFNFYLNNASVVGGNILRSGDLAQITTNYTVALISTAGDTVRRSSRDMGYMFDGLPDGSYWVECSFAAYHFFTSDTIAVAHGDTFVSNIIATPNAVINEIYYNGGTDQYNPVTNPEFVELYITGDMNMQGWMVSPTFMTTWKISDSLQVTAGDYVIIHVGEGNNISQGSVHHIYMHASDGLADNKGSVSLLVDYGEPVDMVAYSGGSSTGMSTEKFCGWPNRYGLPTDPGATASGANRSISLMPDGVDHNSGSDWYETFRTPGALNELPLFFEEVVADTGTYLFDGIGVSMVFIGSLTGSDTVGARVFLDSLPPYLSGGDPLARFYNLSAGSGLTAFTAIVTFAYTQAEFDSSDITNEAEMYAARWDGNEWIPYSSTVDTVNNTITFITSQFSLWSLGGPGGSVPVELSSFGAEAVDARVELAWSTVSETENMGWNIYRSVDAGIFEKINTRLVAGTGYSVMPLSYGYTDATVPMSATTVSYYLVQLDATGGSEQSETVTVGMSTTGIYAASDIGVPVFASGNPVTGMMQISFKVTTTNPVAITVYDMAGTVVKVLVSESMAYGSQMVSWNTAQQSIAEGMYYIRTVIDGNETITGVTVIK